VMLFRFLAACSFSFFVGDEGRTRLQACTHWIDGGGDVNLSVLLVCVCVLFSRRTLMVRSTRR
jgi:hypothetical protein